MSAGNNFAGGVVAMARDCQAAMTLVKRGQWKVEDVERWLQAVIENDRSYVEHVWPQLAAKVAAGI